MEELMNNVDTHYSNQKTSPETGIADIKSLAAFSVPIDKLYLNFPRRLELELPSAIIKQSGPNLRSFSFRPGESFFFEHLGIKVFVFRSAIKTQIQLNPAHFDSFLGLKNWLKAFTKANYYSHRIKKIHMFLDVRFEIESIHKALLIKGPRKTTKYAFTETRKFSGIKSLSITKKFGSEQYRQDAIYDSHKKHGLLFPSTRIECQFNNPRIIGVRYCDDIPEFLKLRPFDRYQLQELVDVHDLKPVDKGKYEHLALLIEKYGLHEALARLRSTCPRHFREKYGRVLERALRTVSTGFTTTFNSNLEEFLNRDVSALEQTLINLFNEPIAISKLHRGENYELNQ
jgi:hypothetical protein